MADQPRVICVGNADRTDDGVGPAVARYLAETHPDLAVAVSSGEPIELIELWTGASRAVVVDAVLTGAEPGTLHLIDVSVNPLPVSSRTSSHGVGLAEAVELGRSLGRLPARLSVVGIEMADMSPGHSLTDAVAEAVPAAAAWVVRELPHA